MQADSRLWVGVISQEACCLPADLKKEVLALAENLLKPRDLKPKTAEENCVLGNILVACLMQPFLVTLPLSVSDE